MDRITASISKLLQEPGVKTIWGIIVGIVSYVFELQTTELWFVLAILIACDTVSGILKALKKKESLKSARMFDKSIAVAVYAIMIATANALVNAAKCTYNDFPEDFGNGVRIAVVFWIVATESKSIVENLEELGFSIPEKIKELIKKFTK